MELRHVRYFLAVARERHFRRAAEALSIAQPALTRQIKDLERELGLRLFDRNRRRVELTPAGQVFLDCAERIINQVQTAEEEMLGIRGVTRGRIVLADGVGLGPSVFPTVLADFSAQYPGLQVSLREEVTPRLLECLRSGEVDLGFVDLTRTGGSAPRGIVVERLAARDLVLVVGPHHRLAKARIVALPELAEERFIMWKPGSMIRELIVSEALAVGFTPNYALESSDHAVVRALVSHGLGVAVTAPWAFGEEGAPICQIRLGPPGLRCIVGLAWAENRTRQPAVSAFMNAALEPLHRALSQA